MYLKHFASTHFLFDHTLPPTSLFGASAQTRAEARLKRLLALRGIGLLTGEPGSGKTNLCRQWCESLHPGLHRVTYVSLTTGNVMDMYISIAWEFGLPTERNRASAFRQIRTMSPACSLRVSKCRCSSSTKPIICETMCWSICDC